MACWQRSRVWQTDGRTDGQNIAVISFCVICMTDVCSLAADPGPCQKSLVRWYYSAFERRCHEFVYGGCEGNSNRFTTEEQCISQCESGGGQRLLTDEEGSMGRRKDAGTHLRLISSVLWRCLQGDMKGIRPVENSAPVFTCLFA